MSCFFDTLLWGMDIYINPDKSPAAAQARISGTPITSLRLKRGANLNFSVIIIGSSSASNLRFGIKAKGDYEGSLLAYAEATTGQATDEGMKFDLSLAVASVALNDALDVGSGNADAAASIAAVAEFAWQDNGAERISDTINTTILNDIIRLATEAPEAAADEYPAPDLVATKSWVNNKQATADTSGFVKLGTDDKLSGKNVRPVGKTDAGGLAVDVSGLSAYEIAKAQGFVGTEEAWLASLKGERGAKGERGEPGIQGEPGEPDAELVASVLSDVIYRPESKEHTTVEGSTSINCRWAQISLVHCPPEGKLRKVTIPCRKTSSSEMTTAASYLGIFEEQENGEFTHIGTSTNTVVQAVGIDSVWLFDGINLHGKKLRICLLPTASSKELSTSRILSGMGVYNDSDGCYLRNSGGSDEKYLIGVTFNLDSPGPLFVPIEHVENTTAHITEEEHAGLAELLANKDALLALLNS